MENINALFAVTPAVMMAVPVVLGLVQVLKGAGLPHRFAPLASLALGVGALLLGGLAWQPAIVQGVIVGLVASGMWSGSKALLSSEG